MSMHFNSFVGVMVIFGSALWLEVSIDTYMINSTSIELEPTILHWHNQNPNHCRRFLKFWQNGSYFDISLVLCSMAVLVGVPVWHRQHLFFLFFLTYFLYIDNTYYLFICPSMSVIVYNWQNGSHLHHLYLDVNRHTWRGKYVIHDWLLNNIRTIKILIPGKIIKYSIV